MLLLIDCGNTNIVFAIAKNDRIFKKWRINTDPKRTADEYYAVSYTHLTLPTKA